MPKKPRQWLQTKRRFEGQKPGVALVKWLNDPHISPKLVEDLVMGAQVVFQCLGKYESLRDLNAARKQEKLPPEFWDCRQRLNETLAKFICAPQIDLHDFPDEEPVSWMLVTEESPIALLSVQVRCVLQLIEQGAILKIRRCQHCNSWFFARFSHQEFCKTLCRIKNFAGTEEFRKKRREYMRDYYQRQRHANVK